MKKRLFALLFVFIVCSACSGFSLMHGTIDAQLFFDGKNVFSKRYNIEFFPSLVLSLQYNGNLYEMFLNKYNGNLNAAFDELNPQIKTDVEILCDDMSVPAVEPYCEYKGDGVFVYYEGKNGVFIDSEPILRSLLKNPSAERVDMPFDTVLPQNSVENLKQETKLIADFSTNYANSSLPRKQNVSLAAKKLDNAVIEAGRSISFNETVGKRTAENGFSSAKIIVNGEYVEGIGGGVCQVSTTLYNAWCLAGLGISTSRNHSLPASYVARGLDAMVSDESDLLLTNTSSSSVYIDSYTDGTNVTFKIYGIPCGYKIKLTSELIKTLPCDEYDVVYGETEEIISPPKCGYVYRSYRNFFDGDNLIYRETLRISTYIPQKGKKSVIK